MPVRNTRSKVGGQCSCCRSMTRMATGTAFLDNGNEALYVVRWTDQEPNHGMAFLISLPGLGAFISVLYTMENDSCMVVSEDGCDWYLSEGMRILDREEVIGTPLAERVFAFLDEIWIHDQEVRKFNEQSTKR